MSDNAVLMPERKKTDITKKTKRQLYKCSIKIEQYFSFVVLIITKNYKEKDNVGFENKFLSHTQRPNSPYKFV